MSRKTPLEKRKKRAHYLFAPGWGRCLRCDLPWNHCEHHSTNYSDTEGCFPLCKECWGELTPERRLPYYESLLFEWKAINLREGLEDKTDEKWPLIKAAVLAGK